MIETLGRVEAYFFEEHIPSQFARLSVEHQRAADFLWQGFHPEGASDLADDIRIMNCHDAT